jgi:hypothetical protein
MQPPYSPIYPPFLVVDIYSEVMYCYVSKNNHPAQYESYKSLEREGFMKTQQTT